MDHGVYSSLKKEKPGQWCLLSRAMIDFSNVLNLWVNSRSSITWWWKWKRKRCSSLPYEQVSEQAIIIKPHELDCWPLTNGLSWTMLHPILFLRQRAVSRWMAYNSVPTTWNNMPEVAATLCIRSASHSGIPWLEIADGLRWYTYDHLLIFHVGALHRIGSTNLCLES